MNIKIRVSHEKKRGCGYRKKGGKYLVSSSIAALPCGLLPIELSVCPCCGEGIKQSRGWTWVDIAKLISKADHVCESYSKCKACPLADSKIQRAGLIWIGEQFYPTTKSWISEMQEMGISRRISAVPKEFKVGVTWIALAHPRAIFKVNEQWVKGIFYLWKPEKMEYVIGGTESENELLQLKEQGFDLVQVVPVDDLGFPIDESQVPITSEDLEE